MVLEKCNGHKNGCLSGSDDDVSLTTHKCLPKFDSKFIDLENVSASLDDKTNKDLVDTGLQKKSCERVSDSKIKCHSVLNGSSDDCSYQQWKHVLESICESLRPTEDGRAGIQNSIIEALKISYAGHLKLAKENEVHLDGEFDSLRGETLNGGPIDSEGVSTVTSNGSTNELGHKNVSRLCERAFSKLLTSEMFALLCKLLSENFHGVKMDKLLDFSLIDSRMKDGTYERTPRLFSSDIQQLWGRLYSIGKEMVSLSNNLSELSRAFCHALGGGTEPDTSSGRKTEAPARNYESQIKREDLDSSVFCVCKECGEKSDERDSLVCDSCERRFHLSCIKPAVEKILPHKSWYCAGCTSSGEVSAHEDCVVCDRMNADFDVHEGLNTVDEALQEEECSDSILETGPQAFKGLECFSCKSCGSNFTIGEEYLNCEHRFCQFKYYHIRCLSSNELKSYGPCWYCPSCLCRVCLTDKDDDDIVMCDGCDHGYHIYCMDPPRNSIPRGKWFCPKCDAGLKTIHKVKKLYENVESCKRNEGHNRDPDRSSKKARLDSGGGSGGVDMLLTAAKTLHSEVNSSVQDGQC